jgi:PhoPQ-activated pathogenicity-related protein
MTKAAVRAMDTVSEFCAGEAGGGVTVDKFVVAGRSKRGWTTWTTAAVDDRVVAIVPIVIDLLNLEASFTHHYRAYGFWAPAIRHYVDMGIPDWFGTDEMEAMRGIVEPYEYRARLTMPKFLLNAAGDEFFQPDSSRFYFEELLGEKYLRYVPNTGHSLGGSDALESFLAFYGAILDGTGRPEFSWSFVADGSIVVRPSGSPPSRALLWQATNTEARDFRIDTLGPEWTRSELAAEPDGSYVARVTEPAEGWTAFLVELTYPSGIEQPFKFTTAVRVAPDTLPYSLERDP